MNQNFCIVVLLGLPASGKSWLADKLCSFLSENDCVVKCAAYDNIVSLEEQAKIALSSTSELTKHYRREMKETVESILATPNSSQKNVMIVDDNNYYRSMRYEYHQLAAKFNTGYLQIYVRCEVANALFQNSNRPQSNRVPDCVIVQMDTRLELPCESWENSLTIDSADLNNPSMMSKIWVRIQEAISNPVSTIKRLEEKKLVAEQSKLCNNHNVVHNIDKALRKQISQYIREHKEKNSARVLAAQLNDIRQSVMEDAKRGIIAPPADILKADESIDMPKLETWVTTIFLQRCSSQHGHDLVILFFFFLFLCYKF